MSAHLGRVAGSMLFLLLASSARATAQGGAPPADSPNAAGGAAAQATDQGWPRVFSHADQQVVLYQPQIDSWTDYRQVSLRMAVSVTPDAASGPAFGVISVHASTEVDHDSRTVLVESPESTVSFPHATAEQAARLEAILREAVPPRESLVVSLDRVLAYMTPSPGQGAGAGSGTTAASGAGTMAGAGADTTGAADAGSASGSASGSVAGSAAAATAPGAVTVNLAPPTIFYSERPALLLSFQGRPRFKPIEGNRLLAALNANWTVFLDPDGGRYYLLDVAHGNNWLTAQDPLAGPWTPAVVLPDALHQLPATEAWQPVLAALPATGLAPRGQEVAVFASASPAELIVVDGVPTFEPIAGTQLLAVTNTESVLFQHMAERSWYYLVAGRWFRAASTSGPWAAATTSLPPDFARIPDDDPHAFVRDSVPGSPDAADAVQLASVPHRATVQRDQLTLSVSYTGAPRFLPIPPTAMSYAANTPESVLLVDGRYYCCHQAVWFVAPTPTGPWSVASSVPAEVYTIPADSPMFPLTFVHIDSATDSAVSVSYTSGYEGEYVAQTGTLMFGLGMLAGQAQAEQEQEQGGQDANETDSDEDWDSVYHYGAGWWSYGCGAVYRGTAGGCYVRGGAIYGPYAGAGRARAYNPSTGVWSGAGYAYGPGGAAAYRTAYDPATGTAAARAGGVTPYGSWSGGVVTQGDAWVSGGRRSTAAATTGWVQTSAGGAAVGVNTAFGSTAVGKTADGDVYAGHDGNVYKRSDDGSWEQHDGSQWVRPQPAAVDANARAGAGTVGADNAAAGFGGATRVGSGGVGAQGLGSGGVGGVGVGSGGVGGVGVGSGGVGGVGGAPGNAAAGLQGFAGLDRDAGARQWGNYRAGQATAARGAVGLRGRR